MATKIKPDTNSEFKSIDRDIREHDWDKDDFDLDFTDSTCPFTTIVDEIKEPGMEYYFALNSPERIDRLLSRKWRVVDPDRLSNKQTFTQARKGLEARDCITTGDTILLERDVRYGDKERVYLKQKNTNIMHDTLAGLTTDVYRVNSPFQDK